MQENLASKRDWILFRERIAGWQEAYIGRFSDELREDVIRITSYNAHGSEKFGGNCDEDKTTDGCYFMSVCSCNGVMNLSRCRSRWRSP